MSKKSKRPKRPSAPATPYIPTAQERAAIDRVLKRQARKAPIPQFARIDSASNNVVQVHAVHPDLNIGKTLLADVLGTGDQQFATGMLAQLMSLTRSGKIASKEELNFMLSVVQGINPADETEALLATQMVAIHNATMVAARRLLHVETIQQQDSASTMLNKLARRFAAQVEALKKYRSAGEHAIRVQDVTVNDGGQAIVGNVNQGDGGTAKNGGQLHGPCATDECSPPLLNHKQEDPFAMPSAGGSRLERVSVSRGDGRSPEGKS